LLRRKIPNQKGTSKVDGSSTSHVIVESGGTFHLHPAERGKDAVAKACCEDRQDRLVVPTDAGVASAVQRILIDHERLVMNMKGRNRADPFVIALAQLKGAVVLTGEGSDGTANRPKIPYICQEIGLPCCRFLEMIRLEGWRF